MIEEGTGAGFGKYQGLPLSRIRATFAQCAAEPSARSISAVLRITREQLEARGQLGHYPVLAAASLAVALLSFAGMAFVQGDLRSLIQKAGLVAAACFALLAFGALKVRNDRKANLAQERAIRAAAVESLRAILAEGPGLSPLIREHRDLVRELIRKERAPDLMVLLEV